MIRAVIDLFVDFKSFSLAIGTITGYFQERACENRASLFWRQI